MTPIISEGYPFIGGCFVLTLLFGWSLHPLAAVVPFVLMLYFCYFFRNPKRHIEQDSSVVLSPADGTVTDIVLSLAVPNVALCFTEH
ncbi:phosphatidylserine decarboxylase, partial [Mitsuokella jalaludinii]|uniref:phosphatidylserine decarboxylase n=1 Tax=Mitsuokella jalaludinii TaxID=187979 RepID=UPI00307D566E